MNILKELLKILGTLILAVFNIAAIGFIMYGFSNGSITNALILAGFTIFVDFFIIKYTFGIAYRKK